jgi:hypothetical protein
MFRLGLPRPLFFPPKNKVKIISARFAKHESRYNIYKFPRLLVARAWLVGTWIIGLYIFLGTREDHILQCLFFPVSFFLSCQRRRRESSGVWVPPSLDIIRREQCCSGKLFFVSFKVPKTQCFKVFTKLFLLLWFWAGFSNSSFWDPLSDFHVILTEFQTGLGWVGLSWVGLGLETKVQFSL